MRSCIRTLSLSASLFVSARLVAQLPEDALRASWTVPSGTAREQAIGGAMGSLGGDISAAFVNPAGLGLYKTREFVLSPGWSMLGDKSSYRGTGASGSQASNFNLGASGFVLGYTNMRGMSNTFAFAVNRTANFNSNIFYQGQNNYSSFSEQYVEEFASSGLSINDGLSSPSLSYGTRMALYTYLIDTATINGNLQVIGQPEKSSLLNQVNDLRSTGGVTELAFSLASNIHDRWCIGGTLGIPILSYTRQQTYRESDASGNTNNDFDSFIYQESFSSKGVGFNGKLGVLFKPQDAWRLGLAIHTPTIYGITDRISASMTANTENYTSQHQISITSDQLDMLAGNSAGSVNYNLYTPWKFIASGTYIFGGGVPDARQQKGFITADIDYTTNGSSRFHPADNTDETYFDAVNAAVKGAYKGSFGARIGGELKFDILMARAGVAYYSSPYKEGGLQADRLFLSGGLGWRNKGMFIDLSYIQGFTRDANFPYRLADKANTFATLRQNGGTVLATVGVKF
jgi:hypothetical protein